MSEASVHEFGTPSSGGPVEDAGDMNPETIFEMLRDELAKPVENEPITLSVPTRSNIKVRFNTDIEFDLLQTWMRKSVKKGITDQLLFALQVLAFTCDCILLNGQDAQDEEGTNLTFAHAQFRKMLDARDTREAIRKLYVKEGHIIGIAQKVTEAAGYSEDDMDDLESGGNPL